MITVDDSGCEPDNLCYSGAVEVTASADEDWSAFVDLATRSGWAGISALAGLRGTVGDAVRRNYEAYGEQVADVVASVRVRDRADGTDRTYPFAECAFGPGRSRFLLPGDEPRYEVHEVSFLFRAATLTRPVTHEGLLQLLGVDRGARVELTQVRDAVLAVGRLVSTSPAGG